MTNETQVPVRRILVLTSHGIRTNAPWQEQLADLIEEEAQLRNQKEGSPPIRVTILHNDYSYFSIFAFLNPIRRIRETRTFEERLRRFLVSGDYDEIHLVGHSFGTHIIAHSLTKIGSRLGQKIGTVILSASVLKTSFAWERLVGPHIKRLVNECGDRDVVLVLNALLPFVGSGLAGRRGFVGITGDHFRNRFFLFGHSGYFEPRGDEASRTWFMKKYWVPLLLGDARTPYVDERSIGTFAGFRGWVVDQSQNSKWLLPAALAAAICGGVLYAAAVTRASFNLETANLASTVQVAVDRLDVDEAKRLVAAREAQIRVRAERLLTWFESLFVDDVIESLRPDLWERSKIATVFAERRTVILPERHAAAVEFKTEDIVKLTSELDEEFILEPGNIRVEYVDLRTRTTAAQPIWQWSGPLAGQHAEPKPGVHSFQADGDKLVIPPDYVHIGDRFEPVVDYGFQGTVEDSFAIALSEHELSLWKIDGEVKVAAWKAADWGNSKLIDAHPCDDGAGVIALKADGIPVAFVGGSGSLPLAVPHGLKVDHVLGNRDCSGFAGVTSDGRLISWQGASAAPVFPIEISHSVRGFEFSASGDYLLVSTVIPGQLERRKHAYVFKTEDLSPVELWPDRSVETATFSPSGTKLVVARFNEAIDGDECAIIPTPSAAASMKPAVFYPCPTGARFASPRLLAENIRFTADEEHYATTRKLLGSFGDSHLSIRLSTTNEDEWLVDASQTDVTSFGVSSDGAVLASASGDSSGEATGSDWSFNVWSAFHSLATYRRASRTEFVEGTWLNPQGTISATSWIKNGASEDEVVRWLEFTFLAAPKHSTMTREPLGNWGVESFGPQIFGQGNCSFELDENGWPAAVELEAADRGCDMDGYALLRTKYENFDGLVQFSLDRETERWRVRFRRSADNIARYIGVDGQPVADDIVSIASDRSRRRVFLAYANGSIATLDFDGGLVGRHFAKLDVPITRILQIGWDEQLDQLRIEFESAGSPADAAVQNITFVAADGATVRTVVAKQGFSGARGVVDASGDYWSLANQAEPIGPDGESSGRPLPLNVFNWTTGTTSRLSCDGEPLRATWYTIPQFTTNRSGTIFGVANLGPTTGADVADTGVALYDFGSEECSAYFEHGSEIWDFAITSDRLLLLTASQTEAHVWHIPTKAIVETFYGATELLDSAEGIKVFTRLGETVPIVVLLPHNTMRWLKTAENDGSR
jgi:hypothetical protein